MLQLVCTVTSLFTEHNYTQLDMETFQLRWQDLVNRRKTEEGCAAP